MMIASTSADPVDLLPRNSTRGASKQRRDQINIEIQCLRDLLPLNSCVKDRLFQLQIMSLACIYIRKQRYLPHGPNSNEIYKALRGFMIMITQDGKILYISQNASEYLGYSEEIMCQGDSLYDLVDIRDHSVVHEHLAGGPESIYDTEFVKEISFVCRMNLSRAAKRHIQYFKYVAVEGRYIDSVEYYKTMNTMEEQKDPIRPIFAAYCVPLLNAETADAVYPESTDVFISEQEMDMKFIRMDRVGIELLGFSLSDLSGGSWYDVVRPDFVETLSEKHSLLHQENEGSVILLFCVENNRGDRKWLHSVFSVKTDPNSRRSFIRGVHQICNESQTRSLMNSPWVYSTMHYSDRHRVGDYGDASSPESAPPLDSNTAAGFPVYVSDPNNNDSTELNAPKYMLTPDCSSPDSIPSLATVRSVGVDHLPFCYSEELPELGDDLEDYFREVEENTEIRRKGVKREFVEFIPNMGWSDGQRLPPVSSLTSFDDHKRIRTSQ